MICAFYREEEFFRCSYFVYNNYKEDTSNLNPENFDINLVYRKFINEHPRIIIKEIDWEDSIP